MQNRIFIGGGGEGHATPQGLALKYANRHGLIAGATATGKTVTLRILAEGLSAAGVSVFLSDVKGDLSGLAVAGSPQFKHHKAFIDRAVTIGLANHRYDAFPVTLWDLLGEQGHPFRTTVAEMGPLLLAQLMDLTEAQEGVLNIAFRLSDEQGLPLLDLKDLQSLLVWVGENRGGLSLRYGNVSPASIGAIQRRLLVLEDQGGAKLFGEPALELADLMRSGDDGRGRINILAADRLIVSPKLCATFLLWLLSELFEELPEVGDTDKPKLVFFFDEAHLRLRRRAQGACRKGRRGGTADPLEGGLGLLRDPEPRRHARRRYGSAGQPYPACAAVLRRTREQLMRGASQIKIMAGGGVSSLYDPLDTAQSLIEEMKAAVQAAADWGTYVCAHVYTSEGIQRSLRAGVKSIEHGQLADTATIRMMREEGAWWSIQPFLADEDANPRTDPIQRAEQLEVAERTVCAFEEGRAEGVNIDFGTEILMKPGGSQSQGRQLTKLTRFMPPLEALRLSTGAAGELLALSGPRAPYEGRLGVIAKGALADILVWDGDPETDLDFLGDPETNLRFVMKDGRVYKEQLA